MFLKRKEQVDNRSASQVNRRNVRTYSYHNVRSEKDDSRRDIKNTGPDKPNSVKKLWLEKFGLIILAVAVVVCLVGILYLSSNSVVIVQGNSTNPLVTSYKTQVSEEANKLLSSSILNKNKITVDTRKIETTLEADFPMYSDISITLPFIDNHPIIYLTPAQSVVTLNNSAGTYLVSEDGKIIERSRTSGSFNGLELPQLNYSSSDYMEIGQQVLTNQEVQFIQTIIYELDLKGVKVSYMSLPQSTAELDVYLSGKSYYVKFNLQDNDPRQQAGSFLATQHYLQTQSITPSQYIDVSTDGRVYYQ